jgi:hypothetical protein
VDLDLYELAFFVSRVNISLVSASHFSCNMEVLSKWQHRYTQLVSSI